MNTLNAILRTFFKQILGKGTRVSYSQDGEDTLVASIIRDKAGVYVDVGAYHPILYSNTYALYRQGWNGIVIDPNIALRPLYSIWRPRDIFVDSGVGVISETRPYF